MSEKQYRICPNCNMWNDVRAIECISCGTDLMNVKPVTKENASKGNQSTGKTSSAKGKKCTECGHINPPQARKCEKCKEDLSDVKIIEIEVDKQDQNTKSAAYEFITAEGNDRFDVPEGQTELILGREGFLSGYLSGKMYVSRQQAAIVLQEDHFLIRNLSRTNPTFVENRELENGKEYSFPLGKEIGLGGKVINGTRQSQAAYLILREKT